MDWNPPTMRSAPGYSANPVVRCACGRRTNADMLLDVRALPPGMREHFAGDFACDGCVDRVCSHPETGPTRSELMAALGAPPRLVTKLSNVET